MKIFKDKLKLKKHILGKKDLSFVPTMGSLHPGHEYLINRAKIKSKKVIVSIYVNPKQFNSKKDYNSYPLKIKQDLKILKKLKVDIVYLPNYNDIFSFKTKHKIYLDKFSKKLCGKYRGKHFKGVVNVVNRFLEIINPKYIFLGKKDYQQLILIYKHIKMRGIKTKVISCKTIREIDGTACSSRNVNLTKKERIIASKVYKYLVKIQKKINNKKTNINIKLIFNELNKYGVKKIDYIKLINKNIIEGNKINKKKYNIFIAYYLNKTRLIDNF